MFVSKFTRATCTCPLLGRPQDLSSNLLPTHKDVLLCCNFERLRLGKQSGNNQEIGFSDIAKAVAQKVVNVYESASIPHVTFDRVIQLINAAHGKYREIKRIFANNRDSDKVKYDEFVNNSKKLFDISSCKCLDMQKCKCPVQNKVPTSVIHFLIDQRNDRRLQIRGIDAGALEINNSQFPNSNPSSQSLSDPNSLGIVENESQGYLIPKIRTKKQKSDLSETVLVGQRFGLSDRAIAAVSSATLVDHGLVHENDNALVIDRNKVRRSKRKVNKEIQTNQNIDPICALYFDGRKDDTIAQVKQGAKFRRAIVKEEHVSVISEPCLNM